MNSCLEGLSAVIRANGDEYMPILGTAASNAVSANSSTAVALFATNASSYNTDKINGSLLLSNGERIVTCFNLTGQQQNIYIFRIDRSGEKVWCKQVIHTFLSEYSICNIAVDTFQDIHIIVWGFSTQKLYYIKLAMDSTVLVQKEIYRPSATSIRPANLTLLENNTLSLIFTASTSANVGVYVLNLALDGSIISQNKLSTYSDGGGFAATNGDFILTNNSYDAAYAGNSHYGMVGAFTKFNSSLSYISGFTNLHTSARRWNFLNYDSDGNFYVSGVVEGDRLYAIAKYSSTGTLIWAKTIKTSSNGDLVPNFMRLNFDASGNLYLYGDPLIGISGRGVFIIKMNSSGVVQWSNVFKSTEGLTGAVELEINRSLSNFGILLKDNTSVSLRTDGTGLGNYEIPRPTQPSRSKSYSYYSYAFTFADLTPPWSISSYTTSLASTTDITSETVSNTIYTNTDQQVGAVRLS